MFQPKRNAPNSASTNTSNTSNKSNTSGVSSSTSGPKNAAQRQKEARERGPRNKQLQEDALKELPQRKPYVVLHIRTDPPEANNFHWGFYYHKDEGGGTKYHMTSPGAGFIANHASTRGIFKSQFLCVLVQIGSISVDKEATLDQIMRSRDDSVNDIPGVTCRVWMFTIIPLLIEAGLLHCGNLASLQTECFEFGNACMYSAVRNDQPRPVKISSRCF